MGNNMTEVTTDQETHSLQLIALRDLNDSVIKMFKNEERMRLYSGLVMGQIRNIMRSMVYDNKIAEYNPELSIFFLTNLDDTEFSQFYGHNKLDKTILGGFQLRHIERLLLKAGMELSSETVSRIIDRDIFRQALPVEAFSSIGANSFYDDVCDPNVIKMFQCLHNMGGENKKALYHGFFETIVKFDILNVSRALDNLKKYPDIYSYAQLTILDALRQHSEINDNASDIGAPHAFALCLENHPWLKEPVYKNLGYEPDESSRQDDNFRFLMAHASRVLQGEERQSVANYFMEKGYNYLSKNIKTKSELNLISENTDFDLTNLDIDRMPGVIKTNRLSHDIGI